MSFFKKDVQMNISTVDNGFLVDIEKMNVFENRERVVVTTVQELVNLMILKLTTTTEKLNEEEVERLKRENAKLRAKVTGTGVEDPQAKEAGKIRAIGPASDPSNEID